MRRDLLSLTEEDLASIGTRGHVRRAQKTLENHKAECTSLEEQEDGTLVLLWSDDVTCTLFADRVLADAGCTCPAPNICRHIIRSVLHYQQHMADHVGELGEEEAAAAAEIAIAASEPWDPGAITDEALEEALSKVKMRKAHKHQRDGAVVELVRGRKPLATFHKLGFTLRFQVPGDVRYTRCDCVDDAPCEHVPLAVWAFRELPEDKQSGFVTMGHEEEIETPTELFAKVAHQFGELVEHGFTGTPPAAMDRFEQLEAKLRDAEMVWPASIIADIRQQYQHYTGHDARFSPTDIANLVGEFMIRAQALEGDQTEVPSLFIRGSSDDMNSKMGQTVFVGMGCSVTKRKQSIVVQAMLQDKKTGKVVALGHEFVDPSEDDNIEASPLHELGSKLVIQGRDLASLGRSQLVLKKATLGADHGLELGRARASAYQQTYKWEELLAPVFAEDFDEVRAKLQALPPASLRPRRVGEDFHVVPIKRVQRASFSVRDQAIMATIVDDHDHTALIYHPYTDRNRQGTERLLAMLERYPDKIKFVSGTMHVGAHGLIIEPAGLVFDPDDDPDARILVQPWVDPFIDRSATDTELGAARPPLDPIDMFRSELSQSLGELYLLGLNHVDEQTRKRFERLLAFGVKLGMREMLAPLADVVTTLDPDHQMPGDHEPGVAVLETSVVSKLLQELA